MFNTTLNKNVLDEANEREFHFELEKKTNIDLQKMLTICLIINKFILQQVVDGVVEYSSHKE